MGGKAEDLLFLGLCRKSNLFVIFFLRKKKASPPSELIQNNSLTFAKTKPHTICGEEVGIKWAKCDS